VVLSKSPGPRAVASSFVSRDSPGPRPATRASS
jgi:hypothetical protein